MTITDEVPDLVELLDQDEIWVNANGERLRLDDMEPRYCGNVRALLMRNAGSYLDHLMWSMTRGPGPSGDMACDAFDRAFDELLEASNDPETWMREQPLLVALARRIRGEAARPAETPETETLMETEIEMAARIDGPRQYDRLVGFAQWVVDLDDIDGPGAEERRTVTLTKIIEKAREALDGNN
ncbi:hypothetical protein ABT282_08120 [Streptomyces sp. NPDC000927]|uniref:hypothetical protein n=1 Tax=Streptomyces sp. NPDC000927 TaxID=3154371 RepID=UPI003318127A